MTAVTTTTAVTVVVVVVVVVVVMVVVVVVAIVIVGGGGGRGVPMRHTHIEMIPNGCCYACLFESTCTPTILVDGRKPL